VDPAAVSRELRTASSDDLRRRRRVVGLSLVSAASMGLISLYQSGIVEHLPEPPLRLFDAERVDSAPEAYPFGIPDSTLGLASYGMTMALATAGGTRRPRWLALAYGAKIAADAAMAVKLTLDQRRKHRAYCSWCLLASAATLATVPLAAPEVLRALRG